ncbi:extracellular solute-binding protein [Nocardia abscessus]|uniref:extracellular solute-binding protein n=1 Tax=Nocardia abscessus TaxID=120957 RepID=UPI002457D2F2|nr:extracellular solute-binding protein [Nocardia abscessus]
MKATKSLVVLSLAGVLVWIASACGLTSGPTATALTIYTARPSSISQKVIDAFEAANPEYKGRVRLLTLGAGEVLERVRAEAHRPQADVWWGGTPQQFGEGVQAGLLSPAPDEVIARVPEQFRGSGNLWLGEMRTANLIFYNHAMVDPADAPKDWDDLIAPAQKRKLLIRDVAASGTMRSIYGALIGRTYARTGSPQPGYDFLRALDRNTEAYVPHPNDLYLRIQRQEAPISVWNLQDVLVQRSNGAPFTAVVPTSGALMQLDGVGKIRGGPHGGNADTFLEFLLRPSTQQMLADHMFQLPTVPLPRDPAWLAGIGLHEMSVDWATVNREEDKWIDYWVQNIKNRR